MRFKDEIVTISENYKSEKLEAVKKLINDVAYEGERSLTLSANEYDKWIKGWLDMEGFELDEFDGDQRNGSHLIVKW